jgi:DNA-binding LacI/PurR family transcriptional regulator
MRNGNDSLVKALEKKLDDNNFNITYIDLPKTQAALIKLLSQLDNGAMKALIIIPDYHEWVYMYSNIRHFIPHARNVFYLNRGIGELNVFPMNGISFNPLEDARTAVLYMLKQNFSDISYISIDPEKSYWLIQREKGISHILNNMKSEISGRTFIIEGNKAWNYKAVADYIANAKKHPAFIACTDEIAGHVIDYLKDSNNYTPGIDYSIIGFDDNPNCRRYNLTTVAPPLDEAGAVIAKAIIEQDAWKENDITFNYVLKSHVIERKTVKGN